MCETVSRHVTIAALAYDFISDTLKEGDCAGYVAELVEAKEALRKLCIRLNEVEIDRLGD